jgi:hypothetical protein
MKRVLFIVLITSILLATACNPVKDLFNDRQSGIFTVLEGDTVYQMDGVIGKNSLKHFNKLKNQFPNVKLISIKNCDGSKDDETNLKLSLLVHQFGINTHLEEGGIIASGGVDFFLAGIKRSKDINTKIGVHSWSDGNKEATDFPNDHANHQPYIEYYQNIGFTVQEASDFYFFTIESAAANSIHWMTDEEIVKYKILTP